MISEYEIIKTILGNFRKSDRHRNQFFQSDSEIIKLGNKDYLITVDTYSNEDHFRLNDPYILGMNLATCTLSDIFACGGKPLFFCNSLNCEHSWSIDFIDSLSKGIAYVLEKCGIAFIGGDFGYCENWNFTGIAIGEANKIVTRKGANDGDLIFLTGEIGRGNFEAASSLYEINSGEGDELFEKHKIIFPLRFREAELVSSYATSCIDTSDGLYKSLDIISEINECGFVVNNLPYFKPGIDWINKIGLPKECLLFGECGEYELLFTINQRDEKILIKDAEDIGIKLFCIGKITKEKSKILEIKNKQLLLNDFNIAARDFKDHYEYIKCLTEYLISRRIS
ncbi:MAG: thiamine-monophosphate kinase [Ignavibacteriales bacterium]|nr:MAG: thiamine-monophosphate kinase [Ignavibacteriales bacterium]